MDDLKESHYFHLPSQGNIYSMTHLKAANSPPKILVATLKRDIYCMEYQESAEGLAPTAKEIPFTYIPSGAEIVSIDAFNKSPGRNEFVIGITIIKNGTSIDSFDCYLNIYCEAEENDDFNIENIAQNCLNVELTFTPYQLTHTYVIIWDENEIVGKEIVFLLSGSDNLIHVYREHTDHLYKETDCKAFFPEFTKTTSPVVCIEIYFNEAQSERISAICTECGYVRLSKVCLKTNKVLFSFSTKLNNFISQIRLYSTKCLEVPEDLLRTKQRVDQLNLLVINTILPPVLFQYHRFLLRLLQYLDVLTYGLSNYVSLPRHDDVCVLSCCQIADIDFDGKHEILVGNTAEEIMVYKHDASRGWCLEEIKTFSSPITSMKYVDVLEDGVNELVVLSMKGVHFLQHDSAYIQDVLRRKIQNGVF